MNGSNKTLMAQFKDIKKLMPKGSKDDKGNYTEANKMRKKQKKILELIKGVITDIARFNTLSGENISEADLILQYINIGLNNLDAEMDLPINQSNIASIAVKMAFYIARAYELFGAALISAHLGGDYLLVGGAGQKSKDTKPGSKMFETDAAKQYYDIDKISRHIDALVKIGNDTNSIVIALDVKSSEQGEYTYKQSSTLQKILQNSVKYDIMKDKDAKKFAYVFVNMAYFDPEEAKNIDQLDEFIKNFTAINFVQEYVDNTMFDEKMIPIVQIAFVHYRVSKLLNSFSTYVDKIPKQPVSLPKVNTTLEPGKFGQYMQGDNFTKMLKDKRTTVTKLKEGKKTKDFKENETFYYQVFSATKKYHINITKKILSKKQSFFYRFTP
jgi:hypothetical protein